MKKMILLLAVASLTACVSPLTGDNVSRNDTRLVQEVTYATIKQMREVSIDGINTGQGASTGLILGGVGGASVTNHANTQVVTGIGGGLLGSIFGSGVEQQVTSAKGVEFILTMDDGRTVALVQEANATKFQVGQRVRIMSVNGMSRVAPD